jgi:beta-galactosidase/beta-glucuronidase
MPHAADRTGWVIMWSVANEPASNEKESESFLEELYDYSERLDNTRPITLVTCKSIQDARLVIR